MSRKQAFLNLFNIIAAPSDVYGELNTSPRWGMPFLFLVISSLAIGWCMIPAITEPMRKIFVSSFGESAADAAISRIMKSIIAAQLFIDPLFKLVRWIVLAAALYFITRVYIEENPLLFKKMFSAVAYAESIFVLMSLLTTLIIYIKGVDRIETAADLTFFRGMDYFLQGSEQNASLVTLLSNINPFSIWYVLSIAIGIHVFTNIQKGKAIFIAGMSWLIWIAVSLAQPMITGAFIGWLT